MKTKSADEMRHNFKSHARKRLEERYGIALDNMAWNELKGLVSEAKFIRKCKDNPNRVERMLLFHGMALRFIWDKNFNEIVTFLPPLTLAGQRSSHDLE